MRERGIADDVELGLGGRVEEANAVAGEANRSGTDANAVGDVIEVRAVAERGLGVMVSVLTGLGDRITILGPPELVEGVCAVSRSNLDRYVP